MGPCRDEGFELSLFNGMGAAEVRPVTRSDFDDALCQARQESGDEGGDAPRAAAEIWAEA